MVFVCFFTAGCSEAANCRFRFTHRPKIRFFAPQGRFVAPIQVQPCRTDGHLGPLGRAKFHINRRRGWEYGPKNIKNFHFLVKSRPVDSLDRFPNFLGAFIRLTILRWCFKFRVIRVTGYGVIAEKTRVSKLGQIFPCTL